jgi:hypothetical protein
MGTRQRHTRLRNSTDSFDIPMPLDTVVPHAGPASEERHDKLTRSSLFAVQFSNQIYFWGHNCWVRAVPGWRVETGNLQTFRDIRRAYAVGQCSDITIEELVVAAESLELERSLKRDVCAAKRHFLRFLNEVSQVSVQKRDANLGHN